MKLGKLQDDRFGSALTKLIAQPLPLRAAFKLKGISAKVREEVKKFEDVRQEALKKFGKKDDNGELVLNANKSVAFTNENLELFANELNELADTDVEVGTISMAELGDKLTISAEDLFALDGIVVE